MQLRRQDLLLLIEVEDVVQALNAVTVLVSVADRVFNVLVDAVNRLYLPLCAFDYNRVLRCFDDILKLLDECLEVLVYHSHHLD